MDWMRRWIFFTRPIRTILSALPAMPVTESWWQQRLLPNVKAGVSVLGQEWFQDAVSQLENFHFSIPHVQNLFDDPSYRYHWVVSLSRSVELTNNGDTMQGVLLVDMNYSSIKQLLEKANQDISKEYVYLMDRNGEIIYHPRAESDPNRSSLRG